MDKLLERLLKLVLENPELMEALIKAIIKLLEEQVETPA
jgi:hypothetical protein